MLKIFCLFMRCLMVLRCPLMAVCKWGYSLALWWECLSVSAVLLSLLSRLLYLRVVPLSPSSARCK